jgi:hypothetical protein
MNKPKTIPAMAPPERECRSFGCVSPVLDGAEEFEAVLDGTEEVEADKEDVEDPLWHEDCC